MKIKSFNAEKVHGYIDYSMNFDPQLTFVTGINGGGKTTMVNSMIALISPDLLLLSKLQFRMMTITIENEDQLHTILAESREAAFEISFQGEDNKLKVPVYTADSDDARYKRDEHEAEFYRDFVVQHADHPVLKLLTDLPTPMFLDVDRRSRAIAERRSRNAAMFRPRPRSRNIFSAFMSESLLEAAYLVEERNREFLFADQRLAEGLRRNLILEMFRIDPGSSTMKIRVPTIEERRSVQKMRSYLPSLPQVLDVTIQQVTHLMEPYLREVEELLKRIPFGASVSELLPSSSSRKDDEDDMLNTLLRWSSNAANIQKIIQIIELMEQFNSARVKERKDLDSFIELVDKFVGEGGKSINLADNGTVTFKVNRHDQHQSITALSSGEAQIFVILSHLYFDPRAKRANVFIIDEPELSLHVHWQELFVDSILSANPGVQYILATHSPAIILDKISNCRSTDLTNDP